MPHRISGVGGGFTGLTAAISAAAAGADATPHEAHRTLDGRARTGDSPYLTHDGPHALHNRGPPWAWLKQRVLLEPIAALPPPEITRPRLFHHGALRRLPRPAS